MTFQSEGKHVKQIYYLYLIFWIPRNALLPFFKHLFTIWDIVNKSRSPYKLHASFRKQTFITISTRKNTQVAVENRSKIVWQLNSFNKFMFALSYV